MRSVKWLSPYRTGSSLDSSFSVIVAVVIAMVRGPDHWSLSAIALHYVVGVGRWFLRVQAYAIYSRHRPLPAVQLELAKSRDAPSCAPRAYAR